jgi:hypothetical protein
MEMNLKMIFIFFILLVDYAHCSIFIKELQESSGDWAKALNIFSSANSAGFLKRLSFENISQQCLDHTQVFHKRITENPIIGLSDGFWELKSNILI